jgi:integrase
MTARADAAGMVHRTAHHPAQLKPPDDRGLPRHLQAAAHLRLEANRQAPCQLDHDDLDAELIGAFLNHLEQDRGNSPRTRTARLAAIHSFGRYAALRHPKHVHTIGRALAIPVKRHHRGGLTYLNLDEVKALLATPNRST